MTAVLSSLLLATSMTGDQAVARTKCALEWFDVKGPFRVQALGPYGPLKPSGGPQSNWTVTLSGPDGARYEAFFGEEDGLRALNRIPRSNTSTKPPLTKADARRFDRWLRRVRPRFAVRPLPIQHTGSGRFLEAFVSGHPFTQPTYGYGFSLEGGRFATYDAREDLPKLGPSVPRVPRAQAERAAKAVFQRYYKPKRVEYRLDPRLIRLVWLETTATSASLAWGVSGVPHVLGGAWTKSPHTIEVYFDAITGRAISRRPDR